MSVRSDQHAIIHELKFDLCFMQFAQQVATCKRVIAAGNLQLATCRVNRPIRAFVDFSCNYLFATLYIFC